MKASDWRKTLPSGMVAAQPAVLAAALDPNLRMPIEWVGIPITSQSHDAILFVGCDALKIGEPGDCVRINVDNDTHQAICDCLGLQMPTPRMADIIYEAAEVRAKPCTFSPDAKGNIKIFDPATGQSEQASMSSVAAMFAHDAAVSHLVADKPGLLCNFGKGWFLTSKLGAAHAQGGWVCANYGWYDPTAPYWSVGHKHKMWQDLGHRHNNKHVDYSQVFWAIHPMMIVDGAQVPTASVLTNSAVAGLVSHEGALAAARHPSLPVYDLVQPIAPALDSIRLIGQPATKTKFEAGKAIALALGAIGGVVLAGEIFS